MTPPTTKYKSRLLGVMFSFALVAAACGNDDGSAGTTTDEPGTQEPTTAEPDEEAEPLRIAYFAASSINAYNISTYEGVQRAAEEAGNVETEIFDGEFSPEAQFSQIEDIVASGRFDGYIIAPNDPAGVAAAAEVALADGPTATVLFGIGPELDTLEPQIEGMITSAASITQGSTDAANLVVDYCADLDPCRVIIIMGFLTSPFDNLRLDTFEGVLDQHDNIDVVAVGEGFYAQDASLTTMQDLLQSNPEFDVLLSNADQHVTGALIALDEAGLDIEPMFIVGGGASQIAVDGMLDGTWDASISFFPQTEGYNAAKNVIASLRGDPVEQVNDAALLSDLPVTVVSPGVLVANPNWVPEWPG